MFNNKILIPIAFFLFTAGNLYAQATVTSTIIEKVNRNAVMIQIDETVDNTVGALEQRMKHSGLSGSTHHNVTSYKAVILSEIASEKIDIYIKVEPGESKNSSIVYVAVSKGYDNFTSAASDSAMTEHIKTFLNSFVKDVNGFSLDLIIASQADALSSEEKDYENLLNAQKDLEKSKTDIENSIIDKEKEMSEKKEDIDRKKEAIEELKSKRAGLN